MSEVIDQNTEIEPKVQTEKPIASPTKPKGSRGIIWFSLFMLFLVVLIAGIGYYLIDEIREEQRGMGGEIEKEDKQLQELTAQITGYQQQMAALQTQLASIKTEVTSLETDASNKDEIISKTLADFSSLNAEKLAIYKKELNISIGQIKRQLGKTRGDWLIADAEYLLSVASQRLSLLNDVKTAIAALEAADQRLRESGDAGVFKVREQLVKEITQLKTVEIPDIVALYSRLKLLSENVAQLAVFLPYSDKQSSVDQNQPTNIVAGDDDDLLDNALDQFKDLVTIRRSEKPIKSIITAEQADFIRQQLKVKLEIASIFLIQYEDKLYQSSLQDVRQWVQENFRMNAKAKQFVAELDGLKAIPISSQMPDISISIKMLKDISKLRIETDKALQTDQEPVSKDQNSAVE